jgi:hypothetical protein
MKLIDVALGATDWTGEPASVQAGVTGSATVRARQLGDVQLRMVDYGAGYVADHWCHKGHVLTVVSGALVIAHQDAVRAHRRHDLACRRRRGLAAQGGKRDRRPGVHRRLTALHTGTMVGVPACIFLYFHLFYQAPAGRPCGRSPQSRATPGSRPDIVLSHCIFIVFSAIVSIVFC